MTDKDLKGAPERRCPQCSGMTRVASCPCGFRFNDTRTQAHREADAKGPCTPDEMMQHLRAKEDTHGQKPMRVRELETRLQTAIDTIGAHVERTADLESHVRLLIAGSRATIRQAEGVLEKVDRALECSKRALVNREPSDYSVGERVLSEVCEILRGEDKPA